MTRTVIDIVLTVSPIETWREGKILASKPLILFCTYIIISSFTCVFVRKSTHKYYLKTFAAIWCVYRECKQRPSVRVCFCCVNIPVEDDWQETVWQQARQDQTVCTSNINVTMWCMWEKKVAIFWLPNYQGMYLVRCWPSSFWVFFWVFYLCREPSSISVLVFGLLLGC